MEGASAPLAPQWVFPCIFKLATSLAVEAQRPSAFMPPRAPLARLGACLLLLLTPAAGQLDIGAVAIAACFARLPAGTPTFVLNGSTLAAQPERVLGPTPLVLSAGSCTGLPLSARPKHVYAVNLGDMAPVGGTLLVHTCHPTAIMDTHAWVGTGCPASAAEFGCMQGGDDNGFQCDNYGGQPYSGQSLVSASAWQPNIAYVLVGSSYDQPGSTYSLSVAYT